MDMIKQLNDSINYIEANLTGNVDPDEAARIACVSRDSYLRFFSYMTGMSLTEYIRHRRLSLAAEDLMKSGDRIIDIALRWGWDNPDAFSRAFVRQHSIAPSALRRSKGSARILPPVSFSIAMHGGKEMDYHLVEIPDLILFGCSRAYDPAKYINHESLREVCGMKNPKIFLPKSVQADGIIPTIHPTMVSGTVSGEMDVI